MRNLTSMLRNSVVFSAEGVGSGAGAEAAAESQPTSEASADAPLLTGAVNDAAAAEAAATAAGSWKEYVPDQGKTDEENAALKAEHDKTKPKEGEGGDKASQTDPQDTVPEDGKYDIKLADGVELDAALLEKASPVMKEIGLTNAQAGRLAGVIAEQRKAEFDALSERHQKIVSDWQQEIRADKDFGGDTLETSLNSANRVIATFGDEAFRRDLVDLGIGNHPGLFRLLARVGNALSDDQPITSETPAASNKSPEVAMYGATTPTTRG